jgi:hypothetical protein
MTNTLAIETSKLAQRKAQLELFAVRCLQLADAVAENRMAFLVAVDLRGVG